MYINILFLQAKPCEADSSRTEVQVMFEGEEEPWIIYPIVFEGGQRLLIPNDVADYLIQALLVECPFTLKVGRFETVIIPKGFKKAYEGLTKIK